MGKIKYCETCLKVISEDDNLIKYKSHNRQSDYCSKKCFDDRKFNF